MPDLVGILEHDLYLFTSSRVYFTRLEREHFTFPGILAARFHYDMPFAPRPVRARTGHRAVAFRIDQVEPRQRPIFPAHGILKAAAGRRSGRPTLFIVFDRGSEDLRIE